MRGCFFQAGYQQRHSGQHEEGSKKINCPQVEHEAPFMGLSIIVLNLYLVWERRWDGEEEDGGCDEAGGDAVAHGISKLQPLFYQQWKRT